MDAFQGCYKFEPYDCRYWAAFCLFLRILVLAILALTESIFFIIVTGIVFIPVIVLTVIIQPYRQTLYNIIDVIVYLMIVQVYFSFIATSYSNYNHRFKSFACTMLGVALVVPFAYATVLAVKRILPNKLVGSVKKYLLMIILKDKEQYQMDKHEGDPLLQHLADNQRV